MCKWTSKQMKIRAGDCKDEWVISPKASQTWDIWPRVSAFGKHSINITNRDTDSTDLQCSAVTRLYYTANTEGYIIYIYSVPDNRWVSDQWPDSGSPVTGQTVVCQARDICSFSTYMAIFSRPSPLLLHRVFSASCIGIKLWMNFNSDILGIWWSNSAVLVYAWKHRPTTPRGQGCIYTAGLLHMGWHCLMPLILVNVSTWELQCVLVYVWERECVCVGGYGGCSMGHKWLNYQ